MLNPSDLQLKLCLSSKYLVPFQFTITLYTSEAQTTSLSVHKKAYSSPLVPEDLLYEPGPT